MKYILLLFTLLAIVSLACGSSNAVPTATVPESAWYACKTFVQQQMGVSSQDAQRYTSSGVTVLPNDAFTVEVYYATLGSTYRCQLLRHANGDWELEDLAVK